MRTRVPLCLMAVFLLFAHSACRRSADARTLATVDSLLSVNDSLMKGMRALDLERVSGIDERFAARGERITALLSDTLRKEDALVLGNYHRTMTRYPRFVQEGSGSVVTRLERCRGQLQDLRSDLSKGLVDTDQGTIYIQDERLALAEVRRDAERVAASVKTIFRNEAAYGQAVDSLLALDTTTAR